MLKAKTKEHRHTCPADAMQVENQKELNEYILYIERKSERKNNSNWSAPTMVAAMKYLMLSGREKNTQSIFLMSKNTIDQDLERLTRCGYLIQFSVLNCKPNDIPKKTKK